MGYIFKKFNFLALSALLTFSAYGSNQSEKLVNDILNPEQQSKKFETRVVQGPFSADQNLSAGYTRSISFSGAAFYYPYHLGVAAYLQEHYNLDNVCFLGSSAGSFIAALLGCNVDIAQDVMGAKVSKNHSLWKYHVTNPNSWIINLNNKMKKIGVYGHIFEAMRYANQKVSVLSDNSYEQATDRVTISLTNFSSWCPLLVNERISSYGSKEDLLNYTFASAHIPWLLDGNFSDKSIKDANGKPKSYIDGGFTDGQPIFNGSTLTVSPYKWSWIWGGKYNPLQILHFYGNTSMERNYGLYLDGYRDAAEHADYWKDLTKK